MVARLGKNGRLLRSDCPDDVFSRVLINGLRRVATRLRWAEAARRTAATVDRARTGRRLLTVSEEIAREHARVRRDSALKPAFARIVTEGQIIADKAGAFLRAVTGGSTADTVAASAAPAGAQSGLMPAAPS